MAQPATVAELRKEAARCRAVAAEVQDAGTRAKLVSIAENYEKTAAQMEQLIREGLWPPANSN